MGYSVADIARMITEDPNVFNDVPDDPRVMTEDVLLEAATETYLPFFNKSRVPALTRDMVIAPTGWTMPFHQKFIQAAQQYAQEHGKDLKEIASEFTLAKLPQDAKLELIRRIQAVVDPDLARYEQYFVRQVALGHLQVPKIEEDSERLNNTIRLFIKFSRKATWEGSRSLLDYKNWRELERQVREFEDKNIEYDVSGDSEILYEKTYVNNALALLLGGPPEVFKYWLRSVNSPQAACKYGKGTMWCTSSDPSNMEDQSQHMFHHYHKNGGLYIIELQTPTSPRRPVLQVSGYEMMNPEDIGIHSMGARTADFVRDALKAAGDKIHENSRRSLSQHTFTKPDWDA